MLYKRVFALIGANIASLSFLTLCPSAYADAAHLTSGHVLVALQARSFFAVANAFHGGAFGVIGVW